MHLVDRGGKRAASADNQRGQALLEYAFTLLLVTLVLILIVKGLGQTTNNTYCNISTTISSVVQ